MQKKKTLTIDGEEYEITQLGALEARKIWLRILKALAPIVKTLGEAPKLTGEVIAQSLATAIEELSEADVEIMFQAFQRKCTVRVDNRWPSLEAKEIFDTHFAGRMMHMTKWFGECVAFNFAGDFLGEASLASLMAMAKRNEATAKSPSPQVSTGLSGAS